MNDARLIRRYGVLATGTLLSKAITFVSAALIGRALGREGLGIYGTAITLTGFLQIASNGGLDAIGTRDVARTPETASQIARSVLRLRVGIGVVLGAVAFLVVTLLGGPIRVAVPLSLAGLALALRADWLLIALGADRAVSVASLARELVFLALAGTVVATTKSVAAAAWSYVVADLIWASATLLLYRKRLDVRRPEPAHDLQATSLGGNNPQSAWGYIRQGWPIALMGFMSLTYNKIDTPLITWLRGANDAGMYFAAYTVVFGALSVIAPFSRLVLPEMAASEGRGVAMMGSTVRLCVFAAIVGAGIGLVLVSSSTTILTVLYGPSFGAGGAVLGILGWILVLNFPSSILLQRLVVDGKQRALAAIAATAAAGNLAANLVLIPRLGIVGAAFATVLSETILLVLPIVIYARAFAIQPFLKSMAWIGLAAAVAWFVGRLVFAGAPLAGAVIAVLLYGLLLLPMMRSLFQPSTVAS